MAEEEVKRCPIWYQSKLYGSKEPCNAKIIRKERIVAPAEDIGLMEGTPFGAEKGKERETVCGGYTEESDVPFFLYECEKGHKLSRPDGWADVPEVPPGTIKSMYGEQIKLPQWFKED